MSEIRRHTFDVPAETAGAAPATSDASAGHRLAGEMSSATADELQRRGMVELSAPHEDHKEHVGPGPDVHEIEPSAPGSSRTKELGTLDEADLGQGNPAETTHPDQIESPSPDEEQSGADQPERSPADGAGSSTISERWGDTQEADAIPPVQLAEPADPVEADLERLRAELDEEERKRLAVAAEDAAQEPPDESREGSARKLADAMSAPIGGEIVGDDSRDPAQEAEQPEPFIPERVAEEDRFDYLGGVDEFAGADVVKVEPADEHDPDGLGPRFCVPIDYADAELPWFETSEWGIVYDPGSLRETYQCSADLRHNEQPHEPRSEDRPEYRADWREPQQTSSENPDWKFYGIMGVRENPDNLIIVPLSPGQQSNYHQIREAKADLSRADRTVLDAARSASAIGFSGIGSLLELGVAAHRRGPKPLVGKRVTERRVRKLSETIPNSIIFTARDDELPPVIVYTRDYIDELAGSVPITPLLDRLRKLQRKGKETRPGFYGPDDYGLNPAAIVRGLLEDYENIPSRYPRYSARRREYILDRVYALAPLIRESQNKLRKKPGDLEATIKLWSDLATMVLPLFYRN